MNDANKNQDGEFTRRPVFLPGFKLICGNYASHIPQLFPPTLLPQPQQKRRRIRIISHEQSSVFVPPTIFPPQPQQQRRIMIQRMLLPPSQLLPPKNPIVKSSLKSFFVYSQFYAAVLKILTEK